MNLTIENATVQISDQDFKQIFEPVLYSRMELTIYSDIVMMAGPDGKIKLYWADARNEQKTVVIAIWNDNLGWIPIRPWEFMLTDALRQCPEWLNESFCKINSSLGLIGAE